MDFSSDFVVDMILNIVGYVAAGALSLVIFSMFRKPRAVTSPVTIDKNKQSESVNQTSASSRIESEFQFVRFGQPRYGTDDPPSSNDGHTGSTAVSHRSNRVDIIRIARRMINAGASNEKIRRVLPISEAELSLLSLNGVE